MADYYDLFLSFSWEDNDRPSSGLSPGWVDRFQDALLRELRDLWSQHIKHFRDANDIKTGSIAHAIEVALETSLTFVCLLSNSYLTSDWCVDELNRMYSAVETDPLLPPERAKERLLPVLLAPLPQNRLGELGQIRYRKAFKTTSDGFWELLEPTERGEGSRMVREVAISLKEVLSNILGKGGPLYGSKGKFFLSASEDLKFNRLGLQASFETDGFPVVPEDPLPANEEAYAPRVKELLAGSRASLHAFGRKLPNTLGSLVPLYYEFESAKEACRSKQLERAIVWIPDNWETPYKNHRVYVENLEQNADMPENVVVYRVAFPELKSILRDACREFCSHKPAPIVQPQIYFVYRLCDQDDEHFRHLSLWLENVCEQVGKKVVRPLFDGDPAHIRQHDATARETSSTTLVYCGLKAESWADSQYELLKSPGVVPARRIFYITPGTFDFAPPSEKVYSYESGDAFDRAFADKLLRPLFGLDLINPPGCHISALCTVPDKIRFP